MKQLSPTQAIKQECRWCMNYQRIKCNSEICQLKNMRLPALKRIKANCLTCCSEQSIQGVRDCTGEVLYPEPHICYIHPFRLGSNPNRKGIGGNPDLHKKA